MKILLDHNVPKRLGSLLTGHAVRTTRSLGWEKLANGVLLDKASNAGFEAFLSIDKNLERQQNLRTLPLSVIVINSSSNALPALTSFVPFLIDLCATDLECALYIVEPSGDMVRLNAPR